MDVCKKSLNCYKRLQIDDLFCAMSPQMRKESLGEFQNTRRAKKEAASRFLKAEFAYLGMSV